jgi:hypothetical protein
MQNTYISEEERLLAQLDIIRKQKIIEEKELKLKEFEDKRNSISYKIRLLCILSNFQQRYHTLNENIKKLVFVEIKNFCEIDIDESFKTITKNLNDINFDWTKLSIYIDYDGCKRLIEMFDNSGAFSVLHLN